METIFRCHPFHSYTICSDCHHQVQTVTILTVMKISENSGTLMSPHVHVIIPAFIVASATIEPKVFGQVTAMVS